MHQLRLALRRLGRQPGFSTLAVLTLALGLGASAAIFAVVDAVLLRPLAYPEPDRLVAIEHAAPGLDLPSMQMSSRLYVHYAEHSRSFSSVGLYDNGPATVSGLETPVQLEEAEVTPSVLEMLAVRPVKGRVFSTEEGAPGAAPAVMVSEGFWRRHLGADPAVLERSLTIDGVLSSIVGVLPAGFAFPNAEVEVWVPLVIDPETATLGSFGRAGLARLTSDSTLETARAELRHLLGDLETTFPEDQAARVLAEADFNVNLRPFRDAVVGDVGPVLALILATIGFVLLLAVVNVANLFVARAEGRQREMAIRGALGAQRRSLVFDSLLEGLLLALAAGVLGLVLGRLSLDAILALLPVELPRLENVAIDVRTLAVVAVLSLLCGGVFGLIPQLRFRLHQLSSQLKEGGRSTTLGRGRHRIRRLLVIAQMAIAILLLIGAGLMARSFAQLTRVDPGFEVDQRLSFRLSVPESRVASEENVARFYDQLLERLRALPGVEATASTTILPLTGRDSGSGHRSADGIQRGEDTVPTIFSVQSVSPKYFSTLGVPLLGGRALERSDFEDRTGKVVVSRSLAETMWPGESALGKRIFPGRPQEEAGWFEVVGVAGDVRTTNLVDEQRPTIYYPWLNPSDIHWQVRNQTIVLRYSGNPDAVMNAARQAVWSLDPDLALAEIRSLESLLERARARTAFTAMMLGIAAAIALTLGAVGTYGVIAFLVAERTNEIGVRIALGAQRGDIMRLVLREGLLLAAAGTVVGLVAATALSSGIESFLYSVAPRDPATFLAVIVLLQAVVVLACWAPARKASGVDPVHSLRSE